MMHTLRFLEKVVLIVVWQNLQKIPKIGQKLPALQKHLHGGTSIYIVPLCEWILNMLLQTLLSSEDPVMIVTLLVWFLYKLYLF